MKKVMIASICATLALGGYAQEKKAEIPSAAKSAFAAKFPQATKVEWGVEKAGEYEAEFKLNGAEMSVLYNAKGELIETETEVKESELPQAVKATIAKELVGYKLDDVEKATDAKGLVTYEMEAKKGNEKFEVVIDNSGKLLKKELEKEEQEDEKDAK